MRLDNLHHTNWLILWALLLLLPQNCKSFNWLPFLSKESRTNDLSANTATSSDGMVAEFSMGAPNNQKRTEKYETAMRKMVSSNSCWQNAYQNLFAGCGKILADDEMRSRLAWQLSDCFHKESGRPPFPYCDSKSTMLNCLRQLDSDAHKVYLEYSLETNSICHQLQADAFNRQTERLVTELKRSAQYAEEKLESIEDQAQHLLQSSNEIHYSLSSIDDQTRQLAQTSKDVQDRVDGVLKQTQAVYEQSIGIAESQSGLREEQAKMKENLEDGMRMVQNSYQDLGKEINYLQNEAAEIGNKIVDVGDEMSLKMKSLQNKADDIGNITGISLDNQRQLLDSQSVALEGLNLLTSFQSEALEESRATLEKLAELGHRQQQELLQRQEQLDRIHDHLVQNSNTILAAQEAFETKQASMFLAIDKLFTLHNAILLESRLIKAFILYSISIFIVYMFTSMKQTYNVRPRLYIGLCATFMIEFVALKYATNNSEQQAWIISYVRLLFVILALFQLLYAIWTYRDYEKMNHQMLQAIFEKFKCIQTNKELSWDADSEEDWSSWVDTDLPEDVDKLEDPDYILPDEVGENSGNSTITRTYILRNRRRL